MIKFPMHSKGGLKLRKLDHSLAPRAQFLMQPQLRLQQQPQTLVMVVAVMLFICTLPFGLGYGEREAGQGTTC
jgi:hypothetical protein